MIAQPTLTDGDVTLRPWRDADVPVAVAGHDELMAHWFGFPTVGADHRADGRQRSTVGGQATPLAPWPPSPSRPTACLVGSCDVRQRRAPASFWRWYAGHRGRGRATRSMRVLVDWALTAAAEGGLGLGRVEAKVEPGNEAVAAGGDPVGLHARGSTPRRTRHRRPGRDRGLRHPGPALDRSAAHRAGAFRALLNSFLPRKRAIGQMLIRDEGGPGALLPADLQAGLGPARRRRRGGRVAAARRQPRGRSRSSPSTSPPGRSC